MSENVCQVCGVEKLTFEPPPIYCSPCGASIKRNGMYYHIRAGDTRHYFCDPCFNEARGNTVLVDGTVIPKQRLVCKKNDKEIEEWWAQCDKYEAWQHQICVLFNGRIPKGENAVYMCPNCQLNDPLTQKAVLGADDLPRTHLSDCLEQRLCEKLSQERLERAEEQGKSYGQVPGAEGIVVRVVSSADKILEVKQIFVKMFQGENYPTNFPYKSKVVLVFQKIEGVQVILFGMYVQEYGSEAQFPNQRSVYIANMDFVPYFTPEIKTVDGEDLSTFVYHEILIGYLECCKKRGFTSCSIWETHPSKDEDYIFYRPRGVLDPPKLNDRHQWYLTLLRKAAKDNIVVSHTNLYDQFFVLSPESNAKLTAARFPYFDGDYFSAAAESFLKSSDDQMLMRSFGHYLSSVKEGYIMVHLQHACSHCCTFMVSGNCWVCNDCDNFQLCDKCYEIKMKGGGEKKHPVNKNGKHTFQPVFINVPVDTKDKDVTIDSEFFQARQDFLCLCYGNYYQFDTLRQAKHSSMMILYHLHNPTAPAFVTTCKICNLDMKTGQGWRCDVCSDYDVCDDCHQKDSTDKHDHELTNEPSVADFGAKNCAAGETRLQKLLDLLVHSSVCPYAKCHNPDCRKVKGLSRHNVRCKTRASGGCALCKRMWYLIQLHSRSCIDSECHVPCCRDTKAHLRIRQQEADLRNRAAVMEMMRRRAADLTIKTEQGSQ